MYMCVCIYIYIYIYRERERERCMYAWISSDIQEIIYKVYKISLFMITSMYSFCNSLLCTFRKYLYSCTSFKYHRFLGSSLLG